MCKTSRIIWCWNHHGGKGRVFGWIVTTKNRQLLIGVSLRALEAAIGREVGDG